MLGFPGKLQSERGRRDFLEEISRVEEFFKDPWLVRAGGRSTVQVIVPWITVPAVGAVVVDGFGAGDGVDGDGILSAQMKRAAMQRRAVAASLAARIIRLICVSPPDPSTHDELSNLKDDDTKDHLSITFVGIYGGLLNLGYNDATQQLQSTIRVDLAGEWLNLKGKDAMPRGIVLVEKWLTSNCDDVTQQLPAFDDEWLNIDYDDSLQSVEMRQIDHC